MTPRPADAAVLDLRLVPAALTCWAVTAAGILFGVAGSLAAMAASVATTAAIGWWGGRDRSLGPDHRSAARRAVVAGVSAVLVVGGGFALAVALRVDAVRQHPVVGYLGEVTAVVVAPTETPRVLEGGRTMFRGSLLKLDGTRSTGKVLVFASGAGYAGLTAGQPAAFRAQVSTP
ncbi:MAG: competence protein, partial [Mycobacterium sp.]|nr:competence protein [Mycobacterium sp.]